ncbi:MAG TPA: hypothetical protein VNG89_12960, partial [Vicinamibacterales bacterium]|nr:hypothetical protein [Vicinamibacterales bacterium]
MTEHHDRILDQFSRQAVPFSASPQMRSAQALDRIVAAADAGPDDTVLDVATGTVAVALELAERLGCAVVGVDQS